MVEVFGCAAKIGGVFDALARLTLGVKDGVRNHTGAVKWYASAFASNTVPEEAFRAGIVTSGR